MGMSFWFAASVPPLSLAAVFVSSRNSSPQKQLRGRLMRVRQIYKPRHREAFVLASRGIMENPL